MEDYRAYLHVEAFNFEDYRTEQPEFCERIFEPAEGENGKTEFLLFFGEPYGRACPESELMEFITEHWVELSSLRENHGAAMAIVLYTGPSCWCPTVCLEPETMGLCAGLGISVEVHIAE